MSGNTAPIFSRTGDIQGGIVLTAAAADYIGQNINNAIAFTADSTNGGFVQRLRFKAVGTNVATVCRVYYNSGTGRLASLCATPATPTSTGGLITGGTMIAGNYYCRVIAVDAYGSLSTPSIESAAATIASGTTGSIPWTWTATTGAVSYMVFVGSVVGGEVTWFTSATNSFTQIVNMGQRDSINGINTNSLIGEISLPATTAITTAGTIDVDYPLNFALPPSGRILVGLGAAVAAGWAVTCYGGKY